ncbi:unnamed protein product [Clonostachys rosea]|uniref:beta-glucosidase n=1 Tax=Bionectria ochroleuca TaxID=29856 RepID=A0ABY6TST5_BIOOC|nr:unnamed protein product [Clonostachys rosea]
METSRLLFDKSIEILFKGGLMDKHKLTSVQAICLLLQVAHNFDKSDLICVPISTEIRISQCLNLHRLGAIRQEIRKLVWCFLVRYDWLQIPFLNTCQIHPAKFNTPMPAKSIDDEVRMIQNGAVVAQLEDVYTSSSWTNCLNKREPRKPHEISFSVLIWKHQDRMFEVGHPGEDPDRILKLYDQADLYLSWPLAMREIDDVQPEHPTLESFPIGSMPGMVMICTAHKMSCVAFGEEPLLQGHMGYEIVAGIQENGVGACWKRYVGNEQESRRFNIDLFIDEATFHEVYLKPFEMCIPLEPWMVMASYNKVNGEHLGMTQYLLEDVLRKA